MSHAKRSHKVVSIRMPMPTYEALKRIAKPTKMDVAMLIAHFAERGLAEAIDKAKAGGEQPAPPAPPLPGLPQ